MPGPREPLRVLGYGVNSDADDLALPMLASAVDDRPVHLEIAGTRLHASELVALVTAA